MLFLLRYNIASLYHIFMKSSARVDILRYELGSDFTFVAEVC